ncbi:putative ribonuclease H-like domain-containing protein [Tanacetum coccineum]
MLNKAEVNKRKFKGTGKIQVNTTRASSTNNVNTVRASSTKDVSNARHNFNSQAVPTNAARKVNTVKPIVNNDKKTNDSESAQDYFVLPIWSSYTSTIKSLEANNKGEKSTKNTDLKTNEKPVDQEDQAFLDELERLKRQEKEADDADEALRKDTSSPSGGPSFTNLTNTDQDDLEIPDLEDSYDNPNDGIFTNASYDDEGAVTDFKILEANCESHAFVSYIQKQRRNNHKDFQHCLFACFLSQIEPKKISEALEDESWVDAMQEETAVNSKTESLDSCRFPYCNKGNWVFAPVARIEAIRIFLGFASYMGFIVYQMDVKSAFLYSKIDEEYMFSTSRKALLHIQLLIDEKSHIRSTRPK